MEDMELTLCGGRGSIPGGHVTLHVCCLSQKLKVLKLHDNTCRSTFLTKSYPWETCSNLQCPGSRPITLSWEITRGTSLPGMSNSHSSCGLKNALRQRRTNIIWCCLYVDFLKNGTNKLNLPNRVTDVENKTNGYRRERSRNKLEDWNRHILTTIYKIDN